jgi:uncharacterized protein
MIQSQLDPVPAVGEERGAPFIGTRVRPPAYHVFEIGERHFVYVAATSLLLEVDHVTHRFLAKCLVHEPSAAQRLLQAEGVVEQELRDVAKEVETLAAHGLFEVPDNEIDEERFERELRRRYAAPWNKLELALSESCNLACKYCYGHTGRDMPIKGLMSKSVARQAITWLFAMSGKSDTVSMTFFGGEPLLNKPVLRFAIAYSQRLAKLHGKKVTYSMTTNGTLLDDEVIGFIKKYNFGLMVSLDGPPDIHDAQRPMHTGKGSFELATAGIRKLMKRRRAVTVRCTMAHPVPRMLDLIRYFEGFGFTRIVLGATVNPVTPSPVDLTRADRLDVDRQEREELIPWMLEKLAAGETPKYLPYRTDFYAEPQVSPLRCGACRGTTTVGADGALYPCHRFVGMSNWQIGTVADGPDHETCMQFWRGYQRAISRSCRSCWAWAQCKGPCPWEVAGADGGFRAPSEDYCDLARRSLERSAYFHVRRKEEEAARAPRGQPAGTVGCPIREKSIAAKEGVVSK